jgi:hypothetical protein
LLGNKDKKYTQTSSTVPQIDPAFRNLQSIILPMIEKRLSSPRGLPEGFEAGGFRDINRTFDTGRQSLENTLSARGLSRSPIAGSALARHDTGRIGEMAGFRTRLPLIEREMQQEDLMTALQALNMGRGAQTTTTSTQPGQGGFASGLNSLSAMLGFLFGQGAFNNPASGMASRTNFIGPWL